MREYLESNLYALRSEKGITQTELAEKVGVTRQTIHAIEKGNYTPSVLLSLKIARVFKVKVENIFKIKHEK